MIDDYWWEKWYSYPIVQFNINRFVVKRGCCFRYKAIDFDTGEVLKDEAGRDVERTTRDVPIYSMKDVNFAILDFHMGKKPHFYCTTSRYDWRRCEWPPRRWKNLKEWRNQTFKPAEESGEFETAKDIVVDIDVFGHKGMDDSRDAVRGRWETAHGLAEKMLEHLRDYHGVKTLDITYTGGGFHVIAYFEELIKSENAYYRDDVPVDKLFKYRSNWAAEVVGDMCRTLSLQARDEENNDGFLFGDVNIDLAPIHRRGVFRTPYSIHPKHGNVVWPMNKHDWEKFDPGDLWIFEPKEILKRRLKNRLMPNLLS